MFLTPLAQQVEFLNPEFNLSDSPPGVQPASGNVAGMGANLQPRRLKKPVPSQKPEVPPSRLAAGQPSLCRMRLGISWPSGQTTTSSGVFFQFRPRRLSWHWG